MKYLAQCVRIVGEEICGPLTASGGEEIKLAYVINIILNFIFGISTLILFFIFVWGGYDFLTSQGNPEKIKSAQAKITSGIIGFILLVSSYLIARLIGKIFGLGSGIL